MERSDSSVGDARLELQFSDSRSLELALEKSNATRHPYSQRSLARSVAIVATCTGAMLVNTMNASVSISLPYIGKATNVQEDKLQWLLSAYSLSSGCLLLFFGRLVDVHGRKKGFLIGMFWQAVFALGLGFSKNGITLDILRGFQGMGPAAAIPAALGILAHSFPPSRARSIAFATFAAGSPIGAAIGTMVGGVLTQLSSEHWRAPFYLSAALSALCALGALVSFDSDSIPSEADARVDWIGAFLVTAGLVLIVFALGQGPITGWKTPYIIASLIIGVLLLAIFILWEHHLERSAADPHKRKLFWNPPPLMKLSIWTHAKGRMAVVLVIAFVNSSGFISWMYWAQLYYQSYLGLTPILTMIRFIPMFVAGCLCNVFVAATVSKLPLVVFFVSGTLLTGIACVLFAVIDPSVTYWAFGFPSTTLIVCGADFVYAAGTIFVAELVLPHEQSLAGGLFQTMTQVGAAFGLTISTIVFDSVVSRQSPKLGGVANPAISAGLQSYKSAQWTNAAFSFFAALLAALFLRKVGIIGNGIRAQPDSAEQTLTGSVQEVEAKP